MGLLLFLLAGCLTSVEEYLSLREALMDADADGHRHAQYGGEDCDDGDGSVHPGAVEDCGPVDRDCDAGIDEQPGDGRRWYADRDGDGFGNIDEPVVACDRPTGVATDGRDCDDRDAGENPFAPEVCGGGDEDCDGQVDEAGAVDAPRWLRDADGDGFGDPLHSAVACEAPDGYIAGEVGAADCDDAEAGVSPGAEEVCNDGVDNDCDGRHDCALTGELSLWYADVWLEGAAGDEAGGVVVRGESGLWLGAPGSEAVYLLTAAVDRDRSLPEDAWRMWGPGAGAALAVGAPGALVGGRDVAWWVSTPAAGALSEVGVALLGEGEFGASVAVLEGRAAIGAPGARSSAGEVVLFDGVASLEAGVLGEPGARIGASLTGGDLDGDGAAELLVGAPGMDALMAYAGPIEGWRRMADAAASVTDVSGAAEVIGDVDGDGVGEVLVGTATGALVLSGPQLWPQAALVGAAGGDIAGASVSGGDLDGDGRVDLVVGDPEGSGAVYVFYGPVAGTVALEAADLRLLGGAQERAGYVTAADLDGDPRAELIVGAPGAGYGAGGAYVLFGRGL